MIKQAALAFVKRTLDRYHKFEDTGKSCFDEPMLRDMFLSGSSRINGARSVDTPTDGESGKPCVNSSTRSLEARTSGIYLMPMERVYALIPTCVVVSSCVCLIPCNEIIYKMFFVVLFCSLQYSVISFLFLHFSLSHDVIRSWISLWSFMQLPLFLTHFFSGRSKWG